LDSSFPDREFGLVCLQFEPLSDPDHPEFPACKVL